MNEWHGSRKLRQDDWDATHKSRWNIYIYIYIYIYIHVNIYCVESWTSDGTRLTDLYNVRKPWTEDDRKSRSCDKSRSSRRTTMLIKNKVNRAVASKTQSSNLKIKRTIVIKWSHLLLCFDRQLVSNQNAVFFLWDSGSNRVRFDVENLSYEKDHVQWSHKSTR